MVVTDCNRRRLVRHLIVKGVVFFMWGAASDTGAVIKNVEDAA
jgi:hypothetical protein